MASSSKKFCLKWNDFQQNIVNTYYNLREDSEFCDVTLVCEEDQQIEAHRSILAASSPFFSSILRKNRHPHPMIYMRGFKASDLVAVVDFIYNGEAKVNQDDIGRFLALAEDLHLKGLARSQIKSPEPFIKSEETHYKQETSKEFDMNTISTFEDDLVVQAGKICVPNNEDLKTQLDSMMVMAEDGEIKYECTICGKTAKTTKWATAKLNMRGHIETHIEGLSFPCNQCDMVSRTSNGLRLHVRKHNDKEPQIK